MSNIIASAYEIVKEIGSGGGGVVYLGRHIRLNKDIALKADKRSLTKPVEDLRREVDALKNLSHTYIPQVYDFVQQDGVVYTVMDYIQGESLDKYLKRGDVIPQKQMVEWSCELLEALAYLHNYPPYGILHSDIKPANIMITPQGDIRLIDFNIAQVLEGEGAVRVGRSRGYASPEHYGLDYTEPGGATTRFGPGRGNTSRSGNTDRGGNTASHSFSFRSTSESESKTVLLDKRSDIYSLGATLYHLFTGERPAASAKEVKPATDFPVNPQIARIIRKAMEPNPDRRYQSAEEMLHDFKRLRENDPRARRHRRRIREAVAVVLTLFLAGGAMTYIGLQQRNRLIQYQQSAADSREALREGDVTRAVAYALDALPEHPGLYDPPEYIAPAQLALTNALGVYDMRSSYQPWSRISLPSDPVKVRMSPDGAKVAALVRDGDTWRIQIFDLESGEKLAEPEASPSSQAEFFFAGNETLFYAGADGLSAWDFRSNAKLWSTGQPATAVARASDSGLLATVYKDERPEQHVYFYDASGNPAREPIRFDDIREGLRMRFPASDMEGDVQLHLFALSASGRRLAVSFADGSVTVFDLWDSDETVSLPPSDDTHFDGGFCGEFLGLSRFQSGTQNTSFAIYNTDADMGEVVYLDGEGSDSKYFYRVQTEGMSFYAADYESVIQVNLEEAWMDTLIRMEGANKIENFRHAGDRLILWTVSGDEQANEYRVYNESGQLLEASGANGAGAKIECGAVGGLFLVTGNRNESALLTRKLDTRPDAVCFTYDPSYYHQEARLRGDGDAATLFSYAGFRMVNADGSIIRELEWDADNTHDPQYRRPGDKDFFGREVTRETLEVQFRDGWIDAYSVENGDLLNREQGEPVNTAQSLETFLTENYRVESVNHGASRIYDAVSGELLRTVDAITYLSYVKQVGDRLILQYTADSETEKQSALMLDENLEEIAVLPEISDILPDGTLIFDDGFGNLRRSRIYSIQDLMFMAKE